MRAEHTFEGGRCKFDGVPEPVSESELGSGVVRAQVAPEPTLGPVVKVAHGFSARPDIFAGRPVRTGPARGPGPSVRKLARTVDPVAAESPVVKSRAEVEDALRLAGGVVSAAARLLEVSRQGLYDFMVAEDMDPDAYRPAPPLKAHAVERVATTTHSATVHTLVSESASGSDAVADGLALNTTGAAVVDVAARAQPRKAKSSPTTAEDLEIEIAHAKERLRELERLALVVKLETKIPRVYQIIAAGVMSGDHRNGFQKATVAIAAVLFWADVMQTQSEGLNSSWLEAAFPEGDPRDRGDEAIDVLDGVAETIIGRISERKWVASKA